MSAYSGVTCEGARSVTGPYLCTLGASAGVVGFVAGIGEFTGYALRLASGCVADRTKAYWLLTFIGCGLFLSIPLPMFAGYWHLAAVPIILERIGKATRSPARDTMLSYAAKKVGGGWGFAVHEALGQVGAIIDSIAFFLVLLCHDNYREGFTVLWIPALLTLAVLARARRRLPTPQKLEGLGETGRQNNQGKLPRIFWLHKAFTLFCVAGFASFQLISYHLKAQCIVPDAQIPLIYAMAIGVDAIAALLVGRTYDRVGPTSLLAVPFVTLPIPFLAFSHSYDLVLIGAGLWGVVMGIQGTGMRAAIADLTPMERRGSAYGIFDTALGAGWGLGGAVMELIYELSISYVILFTVVMEPISIPLFFMVGRASYHIVRARPGR